mmetsp:Transcript_1445/g.4735  ORF Transcript_1445/g.4735 Transcript_1445/m.4735 type:complete len:697 (-) Transcript_1445:162-2252(-)
MVAHTRRMEFEDLSVVHAIQTVAYPPPLWEHPTLFLRRWVSHRSGSFVVVGDRGEVAGYLFTYPWVAGRAPAPLDCCGEAASVPGGATRCDCLCIHDMAVHPTCRGAGHSERLFQEAVDLASVQGLATLSLVAVGGAHHFWAKLGFTNRMPVLPHSDRVGLMESYGDDAVFMGMPTPQTRPHRGRVVAAAATLLVGGGGRAASTSEDLPAPSSVNDLPRDADVVVIGAGLSGLRAATLLKRRGVSVVVLEASHRVGGRLKRHTDSHGAVSDLGGQWIGPQQSRMNALLEEYGIATVPQYDDTQGKLVIINDGSRNEYDADAGVYPPAFTACLAELDRLAASLPPEGTALLSSPDARRLDELSVAAWAHGAFPASLGINAGHTGARGILASEENEVSMLFWLRYIRNARGAGGTVGIHDNLSLTKGGAQQDKIEGGAAGIPARIHTKELAEEVQFHAAATHIWDHSSDTMVTTAGRTSGGVSVVTADGSVYLTKAVIVATPLPLSARISMLPPQPARQRAANASPMASVIKVYVEYATDFWQSRGYSGLSISDDGAVGLTYDASLDNSGERRPRLVAFLLGQAARKWSGQPAETRRAAVLEDLHRLFASATALTPLEYIEQDWCQEPWAGGGYVAVAAPGVLTNYGHALVPKTGRVAWCGADVAIEWQGYMEGALASAEVAVANVAEILGKPLPSKL